MSPKIILIIYPGSLFPTKMASQVRVRDMLERLAKDHTVDFITLIKDEKEKLETQTNLKDICRTVYCITKINSSQRKFLRVLLRFMFLYAKLFAIPSEYYYNSRKIYKNKIIEILSKTNYDIVQVEYWYAASFYKGVNQNCVKVIDTHDILFEKRQQELSQKKAKNLERKITKYRAMELDALNLADILITISDSEDKKLQEISSVKKQILIPTGQPMDKFLDYPTHPKTNTILFYGSMGSSNNIAAFFRLWNNIIPKVKTEISDLQVFVVGSNPPKMIEHLANNHDIVITGYVSDVRPYLAKANLMVLPLEVAGGFRSRIVEVMAMGIPVVGTTKALDSMGMVSGVHGFISDSDSGMALQVINIIKNKNLRMSLSKSCKEFVSSKYSIEATYGKLSNFYSNLENK